MKKRTKVILSLIIGFVLAMIIISVAIFFGYTSAYSTEVDLYTVRIIGIPIYELSKTGTEYVGASKGIYMGLICTICMFLAFVIEIIIERKRKK